MCSNCFVKKLLPLYYFYILVQKTAEYQVFYACSEVIFPLYVTRDFQSVFQRDLQKRSQKLSYVIRVEKMNAAFERVLETFQIENLKYLQREAREKLVSGLDVFVIQPTG